MSNIPLETLIHGDLTLEMGSDVTQFGYGDLSINRKCTIYGTDNSTCNTDGSLIVMGGAGFTKTANFHENINVLYGQTNLTETHIDTTNGQTTITGGNAVNIKVGSASQFITTSGNLLLESESDSLELYGGLNSSLAIDIQATDPAGGIQLLSGTNTGQISLISASGGIYTTTSNGNLTSIANNGSASFSVNSASANQDLSISLNGSTDSQLLISSSGINTTKTALSIETTNTSGNIIISTANGLGSGSLTQMVGSGGFILTTNTSGPINILAQGASATFEIDTNGPNQNLSLNLNGSTNSALILQSEGISNAIQIKTTNTSGNISISQPDLSQGAIDIYAGNAGFNVTTQTGGSINMNCYASNSNYTNITDADTQDLTISLSGNTDSSVIIDSTGTGLDAIRLQTSTGGIYLTSANTARIESNTSVQIATNTSGIPVKIGTTNSTTTIYGNLDVKGVTTTIESQIVTVEDNILLVNSAPASTSDGGLAIKRYQSANDTGSGDVVQYEQEASGTSQGSNTYTTIKLALSASDTDNYFNDWWIRIMSGTGALQCRKIKSYSGSDRIATIYSTDDQTLLDNPSPVVGLDWSTIPDASSVYGLYPCEYMLNIWDTSNNEFALVCSNTDPTDQVNIVHYHDLHLRTLTATNVNTTYLNGSLADMICYVTLNNTNTLPVTITDFPQTYGVYIVLVSPLSDSLRCSAIFNIGRCDISVPGVAVRTINVKGANNEMLDMSWPANGNPRLNFRPYPNGLSGNTVFKVKIICM